MAFYGEVPESRVPDTDRILENPMENVTPRKFQQPLKNFVVYTEDEVKKLLRASWKTIHFLEICLMLHGLRYVSAQKAGTEFEISRCLVLYWTSFRKESVAETREIPYNNAV